MFIHHEASNSLCVIRLSLNNLQLQKYNQQNINIPCTKEKKKIHIPATLCFMIQR